MSEHKEYLLLCMIFPWANFIVWFQKEKWVVFAIFKVVRTFWNSVRAVWQLLYFWSTVFESFDVIRVPACYCSKYLYWSSEICMISRGELFKLGSGSSKRIKKINCPLGLCPSFYLPLYFVSSLVKNGISMLFQFKYITDLIKGCIKTVLLLIQY